MSEPSDHERKLVRELPDITAARQESALRDFRDIVGYYNETVFRLGLCDGHKCFYHKIKHGMHQNTCYCKRSLDATNPNEKKHWDRMHWENCSAGRSMEKNMGCRGYVPADRFLGWEGLPLYSQKQLGRKVV
jgi:hypothetical protein